MKAERAWKWAVLALAALAAAAGLDAALSAPRGREIARRKEADLRRIESHAGRWAGEDAYRARLDAEQAWRPADIEELAVRTLGSGVAQVSYRLEAFGPDGWQRREATVDIREVAYAEAATLLAAASESLPPWRLREAALKPTGEAGKGAATFVFEALEKKRP